MSKSFMSANATPTPREGDLYRVIELQGTRFEIRYGYYEEIDRKHKPMAIYPNFAETPTYTSDGAPFVTHMQEPCRFYRRNGTDTDEDCSTCAHMQQGEELIGICTCVHNRKRE